MVFHLAIAIQEFYQVYRRKNQLRRRKYIVLNLNVSWLNNYSHLNNLIFFKAAQPPFKPIRVDSKVLEPKQKETGMTASYNSGLIKIKYGGIYYGFFRGDNKIDNPIKRLCDDKKFGFHSGLYPVILDEDGKTLLYRGKKEIIIPEELQAKYPKNLGLEDPRVFELSNGEVYGFSTIGNYADDNPADRSLPVLLKLEDYKMRVIGEIGEPNVYDRNFAPLGTKDVNGEEFFYFSRRPNDSVDWAKIPIKDLETLAKDEKFRKNFWQNEPYKVLIEPLQEFKETRLGAGTPAQKIPDREGELLSVIFAKEQREDGEHYVGKFIKLKFDDNGEPMVTHRCSESILEILPEERDYTKGFYPNCAFPTSLNIVKDLKENRYKVLVHYGSADEKTFNAKYNLDEVLKYVESFDKNGHLIEN